MAGKVKRKTCVWVRSIARFYKVWCFGSIIDSGYDPSPISPFCCYCGLKIEGKEGK